VRPAKVVHPITGPAAIPDDNRILYFQRDRAGFSFLSHYYAASIEIDGETWPTVEHFYQAQKSPDPEYRAAIRAAVHPSLAKQLAAAPEAPSKVSKRSWFKISGVRPRADWDTVKVEVMRRGDIAKFRQHADLAALLLATRTAVLIEDSRLDSFWGTGENGTGLNWAGRILMEIRESLSISRG
jgi:ribA/ribD-fused uncharacterized protein